MPASSPMPATNCAATAIWSSSSTRTAGISAYAHCDLILVKKGEKVARGQVIARVGATGNVSEPQLHFELRRGNKPVDPQEFLAQPPTADGNKGPHAS